MALKITSKALEKNEQKMQDLMLRTASAPVFENKNRVKDMLNFINSDNDKSLIQNGHVLAMSNASAQINNISATNDYASGINFIKNTSLLTQSVEDISSLDEYIELLNSLRKK